MILALHKVVIAVKGNRTPFKGHVKKSAEGPMGLCSWRSIYINPASESSSKSGAQSAIGSP